MKVLFKAVEKQLEGLSESDQNNALRILECAEMMNGETQKARKEGWAPIAALLSEIWGWTVPVLTAMDYRYQIDPLDLEVGDHSVPIFDRERIIEWAKLQAGKYGRAVRPMQGVYFIQADHGGLVKIGYASDFCKRFESYRLHSPCDIVLVGFIFGEKQLERELHAVFDKYRARGEWFWPAPPLVEFIREVQERFDENDPAFKMFKKVKPITSERLQ